MRGAAAREWMLHGLDDYVEAFVAAIREEQMRRIDVVQTAARRGTIEQADLALTAGEEQAFRNLLSALQRGWADAHQGIMARYPRLVERATHKADAAVAEDGEEEEERPPLLPLLVLIGMTPTQAWEVEETLAQLPPEMVETYMQHELQLAGIYEQARLERVKRMLVDMNAAGLSYEEQAARLAAELPDLMDWRLRTIARTEGARLYEHGEFARTARSPLVIGWEFVAVMDDRTTEMCASRHGRIYLRRSGPPPDVPPLHFNCRSALAEVFADEAIEEVDLAEYAKFPPPMAGFGAPPPGVEWRDVETVAF
jgi:SPP1 gp7 family putative phage head morphogenesis protein